MKQKPIPPDSKRCKAITKTNFDLGRCCHRAWFNGYCTAHHPQKLLPKLTRKIARLKRELAALEQERDEQEKLIAEIADK